MEKYNLTNRNGHQIWQPLSVTGFLAETYRVDSILPYSKPITQDLITAARYAVSLQGSFHLSIRKQLAVNVCPNSQLCGYCSDHRRNIKRFDYAIMVLMDEKEAYCVTCMMSGPYHRILMDSRLGNILDILRCLFSILRGVPDRCRTRPALPLVLW